MLTVAGHSKRTTMKDLINLISGPQALILFGGIITLVGAFWSSRQDSNNEKELNKKNQIIIEKTEKIAELNAEIVSAITGGDSFPILFFGIPDKIHGSPGLTIKGENAIANISGKLIDIRELRKQQRLGNFNPNNGQNFYKNIISPAYATALVDENFYFNLEKSSRFLVHFFTPYSTFQQEIAIEIDSTSGFPLQAYRIYKGNKKELIYTEYPENFPIPLEEIDFLEVLTQEEIDKVRKK